MKRSGITRPGIRQLRRGEEPPPGEPKRYKTGRGYVRLRWRVGTEQYVEVLEHRLIMGMPDDEVHHIDGNPSNNDRSNLEILTKQEHLRRHGQEWSANSRAQTEWNGYRSQLAFDKAERAKARRVERQEFLRQIVALYRSGLSTTEIGEQVGRNPSNISWALRAAGCQPRARNSSDPTAKQRQAVHARAEMCCERCGKNLVWLRGEVHHRKNRSQGGGTELSNLLYLCAECHCWATSEPDAACETRISVKSWQDPEREPFFGRHLRLVWLTNDGQYLFQPPVGEAS